MSRYELSQDAIDYVGESGRFKNVERDKAICEMHLQGKTYQEIGEAFQLSASRCREICMKAARIYDYALKQGKAMASIEWRWEFGLHLPFCPYCNEPAYETDHCVFCGRKYKYVESEATETKVEHNGYTVIQLSNGSIYAFKGKSLIMHATCTKRMTEDELKAYAERFIKEREE